MPNKTPQPACPECEKLSAVAEKSNIIGEFLDWLNHEKDYSILQWNEETVRYYSAPTINTLLAEYFEIDMDKVEKERMALLKWLRDTKAFETCTCHSYPNVMSADCKVHAEEIFENGN